MSPLLDACFGGSVSALPFLCAGAKIWHRFLGRFLAKKTRADGELGKSAWDLLADFVSKSAASDLTGVQLHRQPAVRNRCKRGFQWQASGFGETRVGGHDAYLPTRETLFQRAA